MKRLRDLLMRLLRRKQPVDRKDLHRQAKAVFNTPAGQAVLDYLADRAHFGKPTFSVEPGRSERNEGKRELFMELMRLLDESQMMEE